MQLQDADSLDHCIERLTAPQLLETARCLINGHEVVPALISQRLLEHKLVGQVVDLILRGDNPATDCENLVNFLTKNG